MSRCTDPVNFQLVGVPPMDILNDVAAAWAAAGYDVLECFRRAVSVTNEWTYDSDNGLQQKRSSERTIPIKHRTVAETLDPQPRASVVFKRLLDWIDRVDEASQVGGPRPPFQTPEGDAIFPDQEKLWWFSELQRKPEDAQPGDEDGPPTDEEEAQAAPEAPTTDEDPLSDLEGDGRPSNGVDTLLPHHRPRCWWRGV